jgi:O-antigen/teichoic acid export membrane protein
LETSASVKPFRISLVHRNVGYLSILQIANLAIPLVTLPWVLRALGAEAYGRVGFYQAIVQYLLVFVDFGFYYAGTKRIAECRHDQEAINDYFSLVQVARAGLAAAALIVAAAVMVLAPLAPGDVPIFLASLAGIAGVWLTPLWLFAGFERMGLIAIVSVVARAATIPLVFLFVREPSDAWVNALIGSLGSALAGLLTIALIVRHRLVTALRLPGVKQIVEAYRDSWHYFIVNAAAGLYAAGNIVVLGLVSTPAQVGFFTAADRIRLLSLSPITPVSSAYYPQLSRMTATDPDEARKTLRWLLWVFSAGMGAVSVGLFLLAPLIVSILMGPDFADAVPVLRILAGVPFFIGLNTVTGTLAMYVNGWKKEASRVIILCGLFNLALLAVLGSRFGAQGAAASLLTTEILVACCLGIALKRKGFSFRA